MTDRYAVELFRDQSRGSGIEAVLGQETNLKTALVLYNLMVAHYPGRLIMLCDRARAERPPRYEGRQQISHSVMRLETAV